MNEDKYASRDNFTWGWKIIIIKIKKKKTKKWIYKIKLLNEVIV